MRCAQAQRVPYDGHQRDAVLTTVDGLRYGTRTVRSLVVSLIVRPSAGGGGGLEVSYVRTGPNLRTDRQIYSVSQSRSQECGVSSTSTRINSAGALLAIRLLSEVIPHYIRTPSVSIRTVLYSSVQYSTVPESPFVQKNARIKNNGF